MSISHKSSLYDKLRRRQGHIEKTLLRRGNVGLRPIPKTPLKCVKVDDSDAISSNKRTEKNLEESHVQSRGKTIKFRTYSRTNSTSTHDTIIITSLPSTDTSPILPYPQPEHIENDEREDDGDTSWTKRRLHRQHRRRQQQQQLEKRKVQHHQHKSRQLSECIPVCPKDDQIRRRPVLIRRQSIDNTEINESGLPKSSKNSLTLSYSPQKKKQSRYHAPIFLSSINYDNNKKNTNDNRNIFYFDKRDDPVDEGSLIFGKKKLIYCEHDYLPILLPSDHYSRIISSAPKACRHFLPAQDKKFRLPAADALLNNSSNTQLLSRSEIEHALLVYQHTSQRWEAEWTRAQLQIKRMLAWQVSTKLLHLGQVRMMCSWVNGTETMGNEGKVKQCKENYLLQRSKNNYSTTLQLESENRVLIERLECDSIEKSRLADEILILKSTLERMYADANDMERKFEQVQRESKRAMERSQVHVSTLEQSMDEQLATWKTEEEFSRQKILELSTALSEERRQRDMIIQNSVEKELFTYDKWLDEYDGELEGENEERWRKRLEKIKRLLGRELQMRKDIEEHNETLKVRLHTVENTNLSLNKKYVNQNEIAEEGWKHKIKALERRSLLAESEAKKAEEKEVISKKCLIEAEERERIQRANVELYTKLAKEREAVAKKKLSILREAGIHSTEHVGNEDEDHSLKTDKLNPLLTIHWTRNSVNLEEIPRMEKLRRRIRELEDQLRISEISIKKTENYHIDFTKDKADDLQREQELKDIIKNLEAQFKVIQKYTRNAEDWDIMAKGKEMDLPPKMETLNRRIKELEAWLTIVKSHPRKPLEQKTSSKKQSSENEKSIFFKKQHNKLETMNSKINEVESRLQVIETSSRKANEHKLMLKNHVAVQDGRKATEGINNLVKKEYISVINYKKLDELTYVEMLKGRIKELSARLKVMETSARMAEERETKMKKCLAEIHKGETMVINKIAERLALVKTLKGRIRELENSLTQAEASVKLIKDREAALLKLMAGADELDDKKSTDEVTIHKARICDLETGLALVSASTKIIEEFLTRTRNNIADKEQIAGNISHVEKIQTLISKLQSLIKLMDTPVRKVKEIVTLEKVNTWSGKQKRDNLSEVDILKGRIGELEINLALTEKMMKNAEARELRTKTDLCDHVSQVEQLKARISDLERCLILSISSNTEGTKNNLVLKKHLMKRGMWKEEQKPGKEIIQFDQKYIKTPLLSSLKPCNNSKTCEIDDSCLAYSTTHEIKHKIQKIHFLKDLGECLEKQLALTKNETRESMGSNHIIKPEKLMEGKTFCACKFTLTDESRPEDFQIEEFNTNNFVTPCKKIINNNGFKSEARRKKKFWWKSNTDIQGKNYGSNKNKNISIIKSDDNSNTSVEIFFSS